LEESGVLLPEVVWLDDCLHMRNEKNASFTVCSGSWRLQYTFKVEYVPTGKIITSGKANCGIQVNVDTSASGFGEYRVCCEFEELGLPTTSASVTKKVLSFEEERSWNMVAKMKNTFIHVDPPEVKEHSASVRARTNSPPSTKFSEQPLFIVNDARWAPTYASGEPKSPQWGLDSATILEKESVRTSQAPPLLLPESSSIQREDASLVSIKEQCALLRRPQTGSSGTLAELAEKQSRTPSSVAPLEDVLAQPSDWKHLHTRGPAMPLPSVVSGTHGGRVGSGEGPRFRIHGHPERQGPGGLPRPESAVFFQTGQST